MNTPDSATPIMDEKQSIPVQIDGDTRRWVFVVQLWKDTQIPLTVIKILLLAALFPALLTLVLEVVEGNASRGFRAFFMIYGITAGIICALLVIAYPLVILIKGGRYPVLFEMDETGITHIEMPRSARRAEIMSWVGVLIGAAARNPGVMGANLLAASRKELHTTFKQIRKVILYPRQHVLKLISRDLTRNLIYTLPQDFDAVSQHILDRCPPKTKIIRKGTKTTTITE